MADRIFVFMCAYNAEKTIKKALESIQKQTYTNFVCHVIDHGSTDNTRAVIQEYVNIDERFSTEYLGQEIGGITVSYAKKVARENSKGYFITLDADDVYAENCFAELVEYLEQESLDVAACGNYFVSASDEKIYGVRTLKENLIIQEENAEDNFKEYYQFMRTVWAKLYSLSLLRRCHFYFPADLRYGSDTIFVMETFKNASRIGILGKSLHYYYIWPKSQSYIFDKGRVASDAILFDYAVDFLFDKCGGISTLNRNFLFIVYRNALRDTLNVLKSAVNSDDEKVELLHQMVTNHYTRDLCYLEKTSELLNEIGSLLCTLNLYETEKTLEMAAEVLSILGLVPASIAGTTEEKRFQLLIRMRRYWFEREYLPGIEGYIKEIAKKTPLLAKKKIDWLERYQGIAIDILGGRKQNALREVLLLLEKKEGVLAEDLQPLIEIGLYLAAEIEEQELFVLLKKMQIMEWIYCDEFELARSEITEWREILPGDEEFRKIEQELFVREGEST